MPGEGQWASAHRRWVAPPARRGCGEDDQARQSDSARDLDEAKLTHGLVPNET